MISDSSLFHVNDDHVTIFTIGNEAGTLPPHLADARKVTTPNWYTTIIFVDEVELINRQRATEKTIDE